MWILNLLKRSKSLKKELPGLYKRPVPPYIGITGKRRSGKDDLVNFNGLYLSEPVKTLLIDLDTDRNIDIFRYIGQDCLQFI